MTTFAKVCRWIPIVGAVLEATSCDKYLSVHENNAVWTVAYVWHGVAFAVLLEAILLPFLP